MLFICLYLFYFILFYFIFYFLFLSLFIFFLLFDKGKKRPVSGNPGIAPPHLVNMWDSVHELAVKFKLGEDYVVIWKTEGALFGS